jgi:hypothetical protein
MRMISMATWLWRLRPFLPLHHSSRLGSVASTAGANPADSRFTWILPQSGEGYTVVADEETTRQTASSTASV